MRALEDPITSRRRPRRRSVVVLAAAALIASVSLGAAPALADNTPQFPSWSQVQAAKQSAAAAHAEYQKIAALLVQVQQQAQAAAAAELQKEFEYSQAKAALDAQTATLDTLTRQVSAAQKDASQAKEQYGGLASQLYMSGGGDLTAKLLLSTGPHQADDLLDQLGAVSQLTAHVSQLQAYAQQKQNLVTSLQAQAKQAEGVRQSLEQDANAKLLAAQAAEAAAQYTLTQTATQTQTLYAQAASLQNKSVATEQQYQEGVQYRAEQAEKAAAANASSGGGGGGGSATIDPSAGCTGGCTPGAAQSYAAGRMGAYGWGGSGQFQCLVDLWNQESGWQWNAYNPSSAAYGIPQAWPASKLATAGSDWMTNGDTQINWGLSYISSAYGTPCAAWAHEMSVNPHWY